MAHLSGNAGVCRDEVDKVPSLDPVTLIKLPLIQCLYGIPSMRKTIKQNEKVDTKNAGSMWPAITFHFI